MNVLSRYCYLLAALSVLLHTSDRQKYGLGLTIGMVAVATAAGGILSWCSRRWNQRRRDRKAAQVLKQIVDAAKVEIKQNKYKYLLGQRSSRFENGGC